MSDDLEKGKVPEGHIYDGIYELDHPLPTWWLWTFLLSIIYAFLYFLHYQIAGAPTLQDELQVAMHNIEMHAAQAPAVLESEEALTKMFSSDQLAAGGGLVFAGKCAVCHGGDLQGLIGPNLTDEYWITGKGTRQDIVKLVQIGVPEKGMPSWKEILSPDEVHQVAAFIFSKLGSNPTNPKAPQGEKVP